MDEKYFTVELEIEAPSKEYVEKMLERMPHSDRIYEEKITGEDDNRLQGRIRYVEDWAGRGEHYLFEVKWSVEESWGLDTAFPLKDDNVHYTALTKVREWKNLGLDFWFE